MRRADGNLDMQATHFKSSPVRAGEVPTKLTAPFPATDPMRLLLIEDDLQAAEYLIKSLREHGYEVVHSADGRDGLAKAT